MSRRSYDALLNRRRIGNSMRWTIAIPFGILFVAWCGTFVASARGADAAERKRPNIIFLFADDQRADTIAALGNPRIKTPTLDGLVRRGFVFHNAYCLGSDVGAVCSPSRNMLMCGRAYFRWKGRLAPAEWSNLPMSLKNAGYFTYHHGKRGNTATSIQALFDVDKYLTNDQEDRRSGEPGKAIVDDAIEFLRRRAASPNESAKPVFMYLAFSNPHDPRVADKRFMDLYRRDDIELPANYAPQHPFDNGEMTVRDERLAPWPRTETEVRRHLHDYYAAITGLDHHIGRLIETLQELQLFDNTILVYSADHGLAVGSHGLMGKQSIYEHSMKSPLVFAGPGIPQGESDALVYLLDIFPTLCSLANASVPDDLDGRSLAPILAGDEQRVRESLFLSYGVVQRAVRDERWKLIRYPQINRQQLFDLQSDPDELHDLSADPAHRERVAKLTADMKRWQTRLGDAAPLETDNPRPAEWSPPGDGPVKKRNR